MIFSGIFVGLVYIIGCIAVGMIVPTSVLEGNYRMLSMLLLIL